MKHVKMVSRELPGMAAYGPGSILVKGSWGDTPAGGGSTDTIGKSGTLGFNELGDFVFFFAGVFENIAANLGFTIN